MAYFTGVCTGNAYRQAHGLGIPNVPPIIGLQEYTVGYEQVTHKGDPPWILM
jgi:hypothetical protein